MAFGIAIAWLISMLFVPIVGWTVGEQAHPFISTVTVLLQTTTVVVLMYSEFGWRPTVRIGASILVMAWGVEMVGSHSGFPFGRYEYTDLLQPQLGDVPIVVPLAWLMMLPPAWSVGQAITGSNGLRFALVASLAMAAWDLFLDPQMVGWRFWHWADGGAYFGIPLSNYAGWIGSTLLFTFVCRPPRMESRSYFVMYATTWLLQTVGLAFFWHLPGPALCGFAAMGLVTVTAWLKIRARDERQIKILA